MRELWRLASHMFGLAAVALAIMALGAAPARAGVPAGCNNYCSDLVCQPGNPSPCNTYGCGSAGSNVGAVG